MSAKQPIGFDPLDMNNYSLEKFKEIKSGRFMGYMKLVGVPLAIFLFVFFHFQWCGKIDMFEAQTKVPPAACYSALGIFMASLVLWITEAIPNYLTALIVVVAVILTGMGKDGAAGLMSIKEAGGYVLAQNRETCVVYGMPGYAVSSGVVDEVLSPEDISERIVRIVR